MEVDDTHTGHTSHPQTTAGVNKRTDTASHKVTAIERHKHLVTTRVIEENSIVAAYPQPLVAIVVGKGAYMQNKARILGLHLKTMYRLGVIHI